tara:strand:- start:57 stop:290 length:234 start_codon:yes stop_codon:yes gene_type:complete
MRNNASIESGMKEQILQARRKGLSYREIQKKLNCSKGLIAYHCSKGQKEKTLERMQEWRDKNPTKYQNQKAAEVAKR